MADQVLEVEIVGEGGPMRIACLLYHDVVENAEWESSGFTGPGTSRYKLNRPEFEAHLAEVAKVRKDAPCLAHELLTMRDNSFPFLLTFDDGGVSAVTVIAGILRTFGSHAHFFVTADRIGQKGFLNAEQIRFLRAEGHVIGSHSFSHPLRMSRCSDQELTNEWTKSIGILSEILNEPLHTASVPGGYYSTRVGETAAKAGIRMLFNSEPTTQIHDLHGCRIMGRYNIFRGVPPELSAELVSAGSLARSKQWLYWNAKKIAKNVAGGPYLATRRWLLREH